MTLCINYAVNYILDSTCNPYVSAAQHCFICDKGICIKVLEAYSCKKQPFNCTVRKMVKQNWNYDCLAQKKPWLTLLNRHLFEETLKTVCLFFPPWNLCILSYYHVTEKYYLNVLHWMSFVYLQDWMFSTFRYSKY